MLSINKNRLLGRIDALGAMGRDEEGKRTRLAASDTDKAGRDAVVAWMEEAGLKVVVDRIGNLFGIWETEANRGREPLMVGSHIDTVINAGQYDGCYGVLAGIEVIQTLRETGVQPERPLVVGAFTNEEGVRYAPDMMGSLVYAGGLEVEKALASVGTDGTILRDELKRIGYEGTVEPGFLKPHAFLELHIHRRGGKPAGHLLAAGDYPGGCQPRRHHAHRHAHRRGAGGGQGKRVYAGSLPPVRGKDGVHRGHHGLRAQCRQRHPLPGGVHRGRAQPL